MAASQQSGGGGDTGGFKAEFYFDYCDEWWGFITCERYADELGAACYNEAARLLEEYGTRITATYAGLDNPINYGFEVYIEDSLVTKLSLEYNTIFLHTNGEYAYTRIDASGYLVSEYSI